jgi:hypothetical protein
MKRIPAVLSMAAVAALALSACKKPAPAEGAASAPAAPVADAASPASKAGLPVATPMLAYEYAYALQAPADLIGGLVGRHQQACVSAGPAVCQVISADVQSSKNRTEGKLQLRATEAWITKFRGGLEADAEGAHGKVLRSSVSTQDLTRDIVDTGAAIRAKTLLRDRLQKLLAERPGKLSELLELEKKAAEVQGEIDASQSELTVMQARVAMSALSVDYTSAQGPLRALDPLGKAFAGFLPNTLLVLSGLVTLLSFLLPLLLAGALAWAGWRWRSRRPRKRTA